MYLLTAYDSDYHSVEEHTIDTSYVIVIIEKHIKNHEI